MSNMMDNQESNISRDYIMLVANNFNPPPLAFEVLAKVGQAFPQRAAAQPPLRQMRQCYKNALDLATEQGLHYVEGYAVPGTIDLPLGHAWCVNKAGEVLDPTWDDGGHYFGMVFNHDALDNLLTYSGTYCILDNLYLFHKLGVDAVRQMLLEAARPINLETA